MQHVREPYNLGDSEYGEFSLDLEEFLGDDRSLPYRPAHLVADIASKGLAFRQKLDAMNTALATRKTASNSIKNCVGEIDRLVRWMRNILPTLSDDSILLPFGLDRKVPDGYAELKDYADTVDAHWQTVKLEPLFAPVAVRMDDLAGLIATYETARALQITADGEYDQFQNEKDIARAEFHEAERLVFNWFAAYYPDGQDMYWEQTPWGKASGGGGGEQLPAVTGLALDYDDPNLTVTWDAVDGADGYKLMMGNNPTILTTMLYVGPETSYVFDPPGGHHYFRVWAMKGEDLGARGDAVDIEIEGIPPAVPKQLKVTRDGAYLRWEWKSGGDVPQYFRLYIAVVATGNPAPSRPDEPDVDKLITLSVSTFAPGSGNTVYGWVTAFGDGAESEAEGPAVIEIM